MTTMNTTPTPVATNFVTIDEVLELLTIARQHGLPRGYDALPKADGSTSLAAMSADEQTAARRTFGQTTCVCSNCGRRLRDAISLDLGIGPVCRRRLATAMAISKQLELGLELGR